MNTNKISSSRKVDIAPYILYNSAMEKKNTTKKCTVCGMVKGIDLFGFSRKSVRRANCKKCQSEYNKEYVKKNPEKVKLWAEGYKGERKAYRKKNNKKRLEYLKEWGKKNPEKKRGQKYRFRYGIEISDYNLMLEKQLGVCAICGSKETKRKNAKYFVVDHCHSTGKIRGLLCYKCNVLIGYAEEDIEILKSAIKYLKPSLK